MAFSIGDAAASGFRLIRERTGVILIWALFGFLVTLAFALFLMATAGGAFVASLSQARFATQDPGQVLNAVLTAAGEFVGPVLLTLPITLVVSAMYQVAAYRAVLDPDEAGRWGYLKLGADELRVALVTLALVLLLVVAVAVPALVLGGISAGLQSSPVLALAFSVLSFLGVTAWAGFLLVRFSLGPVMTYREKRPRFMQSWTRTRPVFWPLAATYLVVFLATIILALALLAVQQLIVAIGAFDILKALLTGRRPDLESSGPFLIFAAVVAALLQSLYRAVNVAIVNAPAASIWRQLEGPDAASQF
jgi:hypothetical protein